MTKKTIKLAFLEKQSINDPIAFQLKKGHLKGEPAFPSSCFT
jgi:hypothetical protein